MGLIPLSTWPLVHLLISSLCTLAIKTLTPKYIFKHFYLSKYSFCNSLAKCDIFLIFARNYSFTFLWLINGLYVSMTLTTFYLVLWLHIYKSFRLWILLITMIVHLKFEHPWNLCLCPMERKFSISDFWLLWRSICSSYLREVEDKMICFGILRLKGTFHF